MPRENAMKTARERISNRLMTRTARGLAAEQLRRFGRNILRAAPAALASLSLASAQARADEWDLIPDTRLADIQTAAANVLVLIYISPDSAPPPSQNPEDYGVLPAPSMKVPPHWAAQFTKSAETARRGAAQKKSRLKNAQAGKAWAKNLPPGLRGKALGRLLRPTAVGRASATIYEERCVDWHAQRYPQIIEHRIYLLLPKPLENRRPYLVLAPETQRLFLFDDMKTLCESFRVNQVGYNPLAGRKDAFFTVWCGDLGVPEGAAPGRVWLCSAEGGADPVEAPVTATPENSIDGGPVWRLDLSQVLRKPGAYYLRAEGAGRSPTFGYGDVWAHHAFYVHARGLYHQRCGTALEFPFTLWTRGACHTQLEVTDYPGPGFIHERGEEVIPHAGGHHDAGDFDVRPPHTLVAGWLLNAYELFPEKFTDGQLNIPESGNGIPDLLDEALWSVRVWENLQTEEGAIRAGFETDRRADELLAKAQKAWSFYQNHLDDPRFAGKWTRGARMFAACQLYLATGEEAYHQAFLEEAPYFFRMNNEPPQWPQQYHGTYYNRDLVERGMVFTHYFVSYLLDGSRPRNSDVVQAGVAAVLRHAADTLKKIPEEGFATVSTAGWGQAAGVGRYADFLIHAWRFTGEQKWLDAACRLADWALGANPPGVCFTSGLGSRPPWNPLHLDSYFHIRNGLGPAPGIVVYGFNRYPGDNAGVRAVLQHFYPPIDQRPAGQTFTDGWSVVAQNEFTIWETMAPNIFLFAALAPETPLAGQLLPIGEARPPGGYPAPEPSASNQ